MRIIDPVLKENIAKAMSDSHIRRIVWATVAKAKSATDLSAQLEIPIRTVYRYARTLSQLGILTAESSLLLRGGGKYVLYRSMVTSIMVKYEGDMIEVDLVPNEGILERFMRFWSYMGR